MFDYPLSILVCQKTNSHLLRTRPQKIQFEVMVLSPQLINAAVRTSALPVCTRASLTFFWFTIGPFAWDHAVCRATAPSRSPAML
jgi:hypothetical protein